MFNWGENQLFKRYARYHCKEITIFQDYPLGCGGPGFFEKTAHKNKIWGDRV